VIRWLTLSSVLAAAPFLEFAADLLFKRLFGRISNDIVIAKLQSDTRPAVKEIVKDDAAIWKGLETYTDFGDKTSDILQTSAIALISLLLSQIETTGSIFCTTIPHSLLGAAIVFFLLFFLVRIAQRRVDPGKVNATKWYYRVALLFCFLVIIIGSTPKDYLLFGQKPSRHEKTLPSPQPTTASPNR